MFNAFKRLTNKRPENGISMPSAPSSHQTLSQNLQKKFAKGVQYNMKIIIKGDRSTGKTCLFHRLQGKKFIPEYIPTEEIQVACIQWNYKNADDVIKVEVWDVVDKGKKRGSPEGLKLTENVTPALDAEFIDVYKGTNGVILVMDITKNWTFGYIQKELSNVPEDVPVLILGNHCDMSHHRTVMTDAVHYYIDSVQRPNNKAQIRYTEASMSNGFGLKYIHKFFCLPFLQLQKQTLQRQLERNLSDIELTIQELDLYQRGPDSDYNLFLDNLSKKRRQVADNTGVASSQSLTSLAKPPPSIVLGQGTPIDRSVSLQDFSPSPSGKASAAAPQTKSSPPPPSQSQVVAGEVASQVVTSVEEFIPDGGYLDRSFLEETTMSSSGKQVETYGDSESENENGDNPLVADYQDDIDPEDTPANFNRITYEEPVSYAREYLVIEMSRGYISAVVENSAAVNNWMNSLSITGGRESPEGGEDCSRADSPCTDDKKKLKKKSKKKSKERDDNSKSEKKKRKKKSSLGDNDLENFLSSRDGSYEAI